MLSPKLRYIYPRSGKPRTALKPRTVCSKQVMFYLETCILTLYIHHTHPHRPHCFNKAISVIAAHPLIVTGPWNAPSDVRHGRIFMAAFCSKRAWSASIGTFLWH